EVPDTVPRAILLPQGNGAIRVLLSPPGEVGAASTAMVLLDAGATRIATVRDPRHMPAAERALRRLRDIHAGIGQGARWRGMTVMAGLVLPVFAVTGVAMWLHRHRARTGLTFPRWAGVPAADQPLDRRDHVAAGPVTRIGSDTGANARERRSR